jgi:hypothetical protein
MRHLLLALALLLPAAAFAQGTLPSPKFTTPPVPDNSQSAATTAWVRLQGFVTVLAGLVDDATTDNAPAVQAAVTAAAAAGKCLVVPAAVNGYALASTITLPSHACLSGAGAKALFIQQPRANIAALILTAVNATDVHLSYIGIDGNKANQTGNSLATEGIQTQAGSNVYIDHISATNFTGDGIANNGTTIFSATNNYAANNNKAGITSYLGTYVTYVGNTAYNNGYHGIGVQGWITHGVISNNQVYMDPGFPGSADGFTGYNSQNYDIVVSNNISVNSGNHGIHFGGNKISYLGNHIESPANSGIFHGSKTVYTLGTLSATNGSNAVTGAGTSWAGLCPTYSTSTTISIGATTYGIQEITGNTTMLLTTPFAGASGSALTYGIACYVGSTDIIMKGNTVTGVSSTPGHADFWLDQATGFDLDNESSDPGASFGTIVYGSTNGSIRGVYSQKGTGVYVYSENIQTSGTVSVTAGSTAVVGTGTTWKSQIPNGNVFRIGVDAVNYVATVNSDTSLTLSTPYAGVTNPSTAYALAQGMSQNVTINAITNNNTGTGVQMTGCLNCSVGGQSNSNASYGFYEVAPTLNTTLNMPKWENNGISALRVLPGTSGIYLYQVNTIFINNGLQRLSLNGSAMTYNTSASAAAGGGFSFVEASTTATYPVLVPNRADPKAGIGAAASGDVSLIADVAGVATEAFRAHADGSLLQFLPAVDATFVNVPLTAAGYTVPPLTDWVWFSPLAAVTSTVTLPTPLAAGQPLRFDAYAFPVTLSFSPAVSGWANGTVLASGGSVSIYYTGTAWVHKIPQ